VRISCSSGGGLGFAIASRSAAPPGRRWLDVGPVHRERCKGVGDARHVGEVAQPRDLAREGRGRLLELGLERHFVEGARIAGERRPQVGRGSFGSRIDEQRGDVVEES
jgi:hypothetical protein